MRVVCNGIGAMKRNKEKKIMIYRLTMHLEFSVTGVAEDSKILKIEAPTQSKKQSWYHLAASLRTIFDKAISSIRNWTEIATSWWVFEPTGLYNLELQKSKTLASHGANFCALLGLFFKYIPFLNFFAIFVTIFWLFGWFFRWYFKRFYVQFFLQFFDDLFGWFWHFSI